MRRREMLGARARTNFEFHNFMLKFLNLIEEERVLENVGGSRGRLRLEARFYLRAHIGGSPRLP